jgi:hypothetical protein
MSNSLITGFNEKKKNIKLDIKDLQESLPIKNYQLDKDCAMQPSLYYEVVKHYTGIYIIALQLKQLIKERTAFISLAIRNDPEKYGLIKITEGALFDIVSTQEELIELENTRIQADIFTVELKGLLDAFEHRRSMLNNEVQLTLSGLAGEINTAETENYKQRLKIVKKINKE